MLVRLARRLRIPLLARKGKRNQRGVALVMAIAAVALISYLAMEVMYEATVEYTVNAQALNRIKAYYAAKSSLDIALVRVKIYQSVVNKFGGKPEFEAFKPYVDEIWKFPFMWPMVPPETTSSTEKDDAKKLVGQSLFDAQWSMDIMDEGSKTDLSDLVSKSKTLRETTKKRLVDLFKQRVESDEKFREKYGAYRFEELINNIADFISDKSASFNGGDKKSAYSDLNKDKDYFPPNRGFRTLQEMRMVKDMNDDFFDILAPQVTIYGMRGINPNVASKQIIQSLDLGIDDRVYEEIDKYRNDPTKAKWGKAEDFWSFVETTAGARLKEPDEAKKINLYFEGLVSFRIKAQGKFATAEREITVIITDLDRTAKLIKGFIDKDAKDQNGGGGDPNNPPNKPPAEQKPPAAGPLPKGPPRIVYWTER